MLVHVLKRLSRAMIHRLSAAVYRRLQAWFDERWNWEAARFSPAPSTKSNLVTQSPCEVSEAFTTSHDCPITLSKKRRAYTNKIHTTKKQHTHRTTSGEAKGSSSSSWTLVSPRRPPQPPSPATGCTCHCDAAQLHRARPHHETQTRVRPCHGLAKRAT